MAGGGSPFLPDACGRSARTRSESRGCELTRHGREARVVLAEKAAKNVPVDKGLR